ncbi:MAG: pyridoxamine 5'-phosphate oxidase family protein [Pseudomonadota bacterium]
MSTEKPSPIRPTDDEARALALGLLTEARFAAIGVLDPTTGAPMVTRVAMLWHAGAPLILISELSLHTKALTANPACSLLVGEPGPKGNPLTHPRITVQARAETADKSALRDIWLKAHPKAQLYFDFTDFVMMRLTPQEAHLNGGFGKAFHLTPDDLPQ